MRWWTAAGFTLSLAAHIGLSAGIGAIPKTRTLHKATTVKMFDAKPPKKKAADEEKKPAKAEEKPKPPPPPKNTPPPPTNAAPPPPQAAMAALPDFGLSFGGGVGGGGIAIPVAGMAAGAGNAAGSANRGGGGASAEKKVRATAPKPSEASDGCVEEPTKPKAIEKVQPQYVDEARAANVEGVVLVEFRVGADGEVLDVRVLQGLGHGLDQAAIAAAKRFKFAPATRCGKPVESRYPLKMRFQLGD